MTPDVRSVPLRPASASRSFPVLPGAALLALALAAGAAPALAGQAARPTVALDAPPGPAVVLTLDEAVAMARERNLDVAADRLGPLIDDARVAQARSAFSPAVTASAQRNSQLAPPSSFLVGNQGVTTDVVSSILGVSQRLKWGGGSYSVSWDSARTKTDSLFTNFNPSLTSRFSVSFSQPLLKDLRIDAGRFQLTQSRRNRDIAGTRLDESLSRVDADVKRAYWGLVSQRAGVEVARQSLELARQLEANNRARVDVGQAPPLDAVSAGAEVAQRQEALIIATTQERQAEDRLRILVLDPASADFWTTRLELADTVPVAAEGPDVDAALGNAIRERADLRRARLESDNSATAVSFYGNQRRPDLRLQATYLANGLGGSRLIRTGGFPGTVVGVEPTSFGTVLNQLTGLDFPTWTVGVTMTYPLGQSADEANYGRAQLEARQAALRLRSLEVKVAQQLREAAGNVEASRQRIDTSRAARELAEQRLDAEQKRFDVGLSTSFLVVQAQRDLTLARTNELQAKLAYERALVDFEALQRAAPPTGSTTAASSTAPR
ncbi:MAG: TolC family protein [Vicinamibacterales bacterium]